MLSMNNKGFTLLEMLLTIFIVTSFFTLFISNINNPDLSWIYFSNEYVEKQADSLINRKDNNINNYLIHFNPNGKVNKAQTINIGNKNIIIHLGTGYFTYEE